MMELSAQAAMPKIRSFITPVSYTHLDVYKRQASYYFKLLFFFLCDSMNIKIGKEHRDGRKKSHGDRIRRIFGSCSRGLAMLLEQIYRIKQEKNALVGKMA